MIKAALIVGIAIVIGGFLAGGRYATTPGGTGAAFVIDRFTGAVSFCSFTDCKMVENSN